MKYQEIKNGYYGDFGGAYIPEILVPNIRALKKAFDNYINDPTFQKELQIMLKDYVGRPSPLYFASNLSKKYKTQIYLKREDLNHTGSHKINNTLGQILLAKRMGKQQIIAETGAGQHGVATATVCALMGISCIVYMGAIDVKRQKINVEKMRLLGAEVRPVLSGSQTLKDACNEAMRHWINNPVETHYIIGSIVGPDPYPDMVARFNSVISQEIQSQLYEKINRDYPDYIIACVGGGSNAAGAFYNYLNKPEVHLIGAEAAGYGIDTKKTAATLTLGSKGILHGSLSYVMQTNDGQVIEPYSISAGLDYPGIGPLHAYLKDIKRASYIPIKDNQAMKAGIDLIKMEGIIPAIESAHALAVLEKQTFNPKNIVIINLSGRGDKDLQTYQNWFSVKNSL